MRLVIFDVDGTLVDSQGDILAAMGLAFERVGCSVPNREEVLSIAGLSLPQAMAELAPDLSAEVQAAMVTHYKEAYATLRREGGVAATSPLFPGARACLEALHGEPETLLAIATGKSRRGLDVLLDGHDLRGFFVSTQVADTHPSKPHPAMIEACLSETGLEPGQAVIVGDTSFDMEMGAAAGVARLGVAWGYHPAERLVLAEAIAPDFAAVPALVDRLLGVPA